MEKISDTLNHVALVAKEDGNYATIVCFRHAVKEDETAIDFLKGEAQRFINDTPEFSNAKVFIKTKLELRQAVIDISGGNKRHLRIDPHGLFFKDPTYQTPEEYSNEMKLLIKAKLIKGQPLSEKEANYLLRIKD